jgi:AcrR family transcriptional regulator
MPVPRATLDPSSSIMAARPLSSPLPSERSTSAGATLDRAPQPTMPVLVREAILREAVSLATLDGLEGLSIGNLAGALAMSNSGIYAHFGSKQDLQLATVDEAGRIFQAEVIEAALAAEPGTRAGHRRVRRLLRPPPAAHVPWWLLLRRRGPGDGHPPGTGQGTDRGASG